MIDFNLNICCNCFTTHKAKKEMHLWNAMLGIVEMKDELVLTLPYIYINTVKYMSMYTDQIILHFHYSNHCENSLNVTLLLQTRPTLRICTLTLLLPIFWQLCSLSAIFILTARGILESQAFKFSKISIFLPFLSFMFNKYLNLKYQSQEYLKTTY